MTPERWPRIKEVFGTAFELPKSERTAFLDLSCHGDPELRAEVELLLAGEGQPSWPSPGAMFVTASARLAAGETLAQYRIETKLGEGGMGVVYRAYDTRLQRPVALKLLLSERAANPDTRQRLLREARAVSALSHPNIVTVYEIGCENGVDFIAMEYVEGHPLAHAIRTNGLPLMRALDYAIGIAGALAKAHAAGVVHRDLKPANVMVAADGRVKLLDFGLARRVRLPDSVSATLTVDGIDGTIAGTPSYMSPEQVRGLALDARTDIFSLGVVLYEMIAGRRPFEGETTVQAITAILEKRPLPLARYVPGIPEELQRIITKALEKDREERYQVVKDLELDLKRLQQELALDAAASLSPGLAIRRINKTVGLAVLAVIAAAVLLVVYLRRGPALTTKDSVLLADFVNTTGDSAFDLTLKEALAIALEQSPFLNIFPDERVRETLAYMGRSPEEGVTKEIAKEICQRRGVKALLAGSIAPLGSHYVISLDAIEAATGEVIARQQLEAESKESVLRTLGAAATGIRGKLGESLSSIRKYDAPIEQVTTSSLEALKAFSLAMRLNNEYKYRQAIPFSQRAVELDPNFARAFAQLGQIYRNAGQPDFSLQFTRKAFELRERSSQLEQLYISGAYYLFVTQEVDKALESIEAIKQIFPRDGIGRTMLATAYISIGRSEKALEEGREANRLAPTALGYGNLAYNLIRNNLFAEAKQVCEQAAAQKLDSGRCRGHLYNIAFVTGDAAGMKQYASNMNLELYTAFSGQMGRMREAILQLVLRQAAQSGTSELRSGNMQSLATKEALMGDCRHARVDAQADLGFSQPSFSIREAALTLAICGETKQARNLLDEFVARFPKSTLGNAVWLPEIQAAIAIHANEPAEAIRELQAALPYAGATAYRPEYLRGQAYLLQRSGKEAATEFQKILDHRGLNIADVLWPLAHLGLARSAALMGDTAKSRKAYQDLFALWKDADADLPVLVEAKREYARLPGSRDIPQ